MAALSWVGAVVVKKTRNRMVRPVHRHKEARPTCVHACEYVRANAYGNVRA